MRAPTRKKLEYGIHVYFYENYNDEDKHFVIGTGLELDIYFNNNPGKREKKTKYLGEFYSFRPAIQKAKDFYIDENRPEDDYIKVVDWIHNP